LTCTKIGFVQEFVQEVRNEKPSKSKMATAQRTSDPLLTRNAPLSTLALANIVASLSPRAILAIVEFPVSTFVTVDFTLRCGRTAATAGKPHDAFRSLMTMAHRSAPSLLPKLR